MAVFSLERTVPLTPDEAWRRLTRWERHGDTGPLAFDDTMEVTVWRPPREDAPGRCRLEKRGRVVGGWAEIEVGAGPGGRARVVWREELDVRLLPSFLDGLLARSGRHVFGRTVTHLLRHP